MTNQEFNALTKGDRVTVNASGKTYEVGFINTLESMVAEEVRFEAGESNSHWGRGRIATGLNRVSFRQIRANSKGQVVPYGPSTGLKPENITRA